MFDKYLIKFLVEKYQSAGPRYTSYPTAVEFSPLVGSEAWRAALQADINSRPHDLTALYLHAPFCKSLCYFCACNKIIDPALKKLDLFLDAACRELNSYRRFENITINQIHWGGGSPSFLPPEAIERLCDKIDLVFPQRSERPELSVEIDPRTSSAEQLRHFRRRGFNRLSMGVQDFDADVQRIVNRNQSAELTASIFHAARDAGFGGVNIDLIYGLPGQTLAGFKRSIDTVISLRPDRIALYGYAHVTWIRKVQKAMERVHIPGAAERLELFLWALELLSQAGYEYIGLDHFALPTDDLAQARKDGRLNRNFMGYTTNRGARLLGIGPSAISGVPAAMVQNERSLEEYAQAVFSSGWAISRGIELGADDMIRASVIHDLMCRGTVDIPQIERANSTGDFWNYFSRERFELEELEQDGILSVSDKELALTDIGRLFARNAAMVFDAYLPQHRQSGTQVFSQTV